MQVHLEVHFAMKITARLSESMQEMPIDIGERLKAARNGALVARKIKSQEFHRVSRVAVASLAGGPDGFWRSTFNGRLQALLSVIPLIALAVGLFCVSTVSQKNIYIEKATLDAEILVDALPPAAYLDPGFVQFLKYSKK